MSTKKWRGLAKQRRGQIGVNVVERIVLEDWGSRWQSLDSQNDDGIDGLIFLEKADNLTGQIVYVQVKCHDISVRRGRISLALGSAESRRVSDRWKRWNRLIGAAVLVHVDPKTLTARWVDLQAKGSIPKSKIEISSNQFFDKNAKGVIQKLCGTIHRDAVAVNVATVASDFTHLGAKDHIQVSARKLYKGLAEQPITIGNTADSVVFTREGWRHITRPGRPILTRLQSFFLLGTVRPILRAINSSDLKRQPTPHEPDDEEYYVIKAAVTFPHRQSAIVKIVVHRNSDDATGRYRFHTIYEPRRKKTITGRR